MHKMPENREFPRMAIDCGITYNVLDAPEARSAVIKNISGGGVLFLAEEEPQIGAMMEIKVNPGNISIPPLSAVVEVVRVNPGSTSEWRSGPESAGVVMALEKSEPAACYEVGARIMSVK